MSLDSLDTISEGADQDFWMDDETDTAIFALDL